MITWKILSEVHFLLMSLSVFKSFFALSTGNSFWLAALFNFVHLFRWDYSATEEAIKEVLEELNHNLQIPCNFTLTAACYDPSKPQKHMQPVHTINPQTTEFCAQFGLTDINTRIQQAKEEGSVRGDYEEDEEEEEMDSTGSAEEPSDYNTDNSGLSSINPDEILLDEEGDDEDLSTCSVDPSPDHPPEFSASFSDVRIMPDSMAVSSDDAMDSTNEELERSAERKQVEEKSLNERPLKRASGNENGNTGIKIKRRNQAIYAAEDEDKPEWYFMWHVYISALSVCLGEGAENCGGLLMLLMFQFLLFLKLKRLYAPIIGRKVYLDWTSKS